jgi:hypothetical protein
LCVRDGPGMSAFASSLINWSALGNIVVAALIGGAGVVIALGLALLALEHARACNRVGGLLAHWALAGVCGLFCIGAVAVGVYTMAEKPSAKSAAKPKPPSLSARSHRPAT